VGEPAYAYLSRPHMAARRIQRTAAPGHSRYSSPSSCRVAFQKTARNPDNHGGLFVTRIARPRGCRARFRSSPLLGNFQASSCSLSTGRDVTVTRRGRRRRQFLCKDTNGLYDACVRMGMGAAGKFDGMSSFSLSEVSAQPASVARIRAWSRGFGHFRPCSPL
jgi:hypothetical protein